MASSAYLKVDRATKHVIELNDLLREQRPFSYILETNTNTRQRSTFAKKNEAVVNSAALICGEAVHSLRSALDYVYWDIVSPLVNDERERKKIQFPFRETKTRFDEAVQKGLPNGVTPSFRKALLDLKAYGEPGGNELLYLIDKLDIVDKHKLLIPTGDYTTISGDIIRMQVPDFPAQVGLMHFGMNRRDVGWTAQSLPRDLGEAVPPTLNIFEKELDVPVEIVFAIPPLANLRPVIPTLHQLVDVTRCVVDILTNA